MKTLHLQDCEIKCQSRPFKEELSIVIHKNGIFQSSGLIKNPSSDKEILHFAKQLLKRRNKKP